MSLDLTGIHNVGEFYSHHYLTALLEGDLKATLSGWLAAEKDGGAKTPAKRLAGLANKFFVWQGQASGVSSTEARLEPARELHAHLLEALGYERRPGVEEIGDGEVVPVVTTEEVDRRPFLWVIEAPFAPDEDDADPLAECPHPAQVPEGIGPVKLPTESWRELLDGRLLRREDAPRWVIVLAGTDVFLVDRDKWAQGKFLHFSLGELMGRRQAKAMRAMAGLLHREVILPEGGSSVLDTLDESSHKHAFAVSTDLKYGARQAIELIANEAIRHVREVRKEKLYGDEELAKKLTRESLTYLYRLLFLFYVEARSAEMEDDKGNAVVPMKSDAYRLGYSLETLRDLEMVPLTSAQARQGTFLDASLRRLFDLVFKGHGYGQRDLKYDRGAASDFAISGLRSPLFDEGRTPILRGVKLRNEVVQKVLQLLSLSKEGRGRGRGGSRGRISYATLGINQLGAVYEGLLSYSGFFAEEDLYEIRAAKEMNDPEARTYFVGKDKIEEYLEEEKVKDDRGRAVVHAKGAYLFRMAGRDREKSASYYTPEVLTRCLTKYTLKERLGEVGSEGYVPADEILALTVCEPAMGSGAFLNEAVNQLADAYLERKQAEVGRKIAPERYAIEKQRVKYWIAANNCYGVDLNPLAAELGKISLWLNVLQPGVEAPYFDQRLAVGNSLIGGRREVFDGVDLMKGGGKKGDGWLGAVPKKVGFGEERPAGSVYHFLVPDLGMVPFDGDKVIKELEPEGVKAIKAWRKEICKPYSKAEVGELVRLSDRVDVLWRDLVLMRERVLGEVRQAYPVWPASEEVVEEKDKVRVPLVEECEEKGKHLGKAGAPGERLKAVMDYWVALWFWPISEAGRLPERGEWLADVEGALQRAVGAAGDEGEVARWGVVAGVVERERPQHWEVRFAEVFAGRGGFDVILGNPPWIKMEWREAGVLGDLLPSIELRGLSAKQVSTERGALLQHRKNLGSYTSAFESSAGMSAYLVSPRLFPLLEGIQTNLYKCFLVTAWTISGRDGAIGLFHQTGIFDDPRGGRLRRALLPRLRWAITFKNELMLFSEIGHPRPFAFTVSRTAAQETANFSLVGILLHPRTLDDAVTHDNVGVVPGMKGEDGHWNLRGHRSRIVEVDDAALALFANLYDPPGTPALEARLPVIHSREILEVLRKFADAPQKLGDIPDEWSSTVCFDETNRQTDGTIKRETRFPTNVNEWIVSGPHFYVGSPFNKTPNEGCRTKGDYSVIDLAEIPDDYLPRTNYVPACSPAEYRKRTPHWNERPVTEFYRHVHREMVAPTGERTLVPAILFPGPGHVHTVFGIAFEKPKLLATYTGLCSSLVADFFVKTTGMGHVNRTLAAQLPSSAAPQLLPLIQARVARLNSLTSHYSDLWQELFSATWRTDRCAKDDPRLPAWSGLSEQWSPRVALRTPYARRQALVELDALAALALGLSADELCLIYRIQFPVLQQYERETYYDQRGMIVFTTNRGLAGVGLDRKQWEEIQHAQPGTPLPPFATAFLPPFDRCDRETDMRGAHTFFAHGSKEQGSTQPGTKRQTKGKTIDP